MPSQVVPKNLTPGATAARAHPHRNSKAGDGSNRKEEARGAPAVNQFGAAENVPVTSRKLFAAMPASDSLEVRLDGYYQDIKTVILSRQDPRTGLLPASTAVTAHGNYTDAWVRDNVYSILSVWGLALAYRKQDEDRGRTFELEGSVIKLMRGLLFAMMRQVDKVEKFKVTQSPADALHAKYNTRTGDTVVGDDQWGHLQLDATSLFLLMLAQMTASGLIIIFTIDEVNFVQNLVYYIGRAYGTPDFGIWERGNKINHGYAELNASSIGMAKAALEAMNGLDLFGVRGSQASVVHVLPDEIARARITLESLLPWESSSKEVDAALLSIIGFPAFAVEDCDLVELTRTRIVDRLQGNYGCKRFLRDGHQTVIEDSGRIYYEPWELKQFEGIESEWPLFFTYLRLDALFRGDEEEADFYRDRLESVLVEQDGLSLLPELYYVPADRLDAERKEPHSQVRVPNANVPLVWAQSLYTLGALLVEGLIAPGDIDPLGRHRRVGMERPPVVQVALLSEDEGLQFEMETYGIASGTPKQIEPVEVRHAGELSAAYHQIGRNDKLNLTGRPIRRLRSLTTSRIFRIRGELMVFLPSFLDSQQFYLTLDPAFLVAQMKGELGYIQRHWRQLGRPTLTLLLTRPMVETGREALLGLIGELASGECGGVRVKLAPLKQLVSMAAMERVDYLHDFEFSLEPVKDSVPGTRFLQWTPERTIPLEPAEERWLEREDHTPSLLERLRESRNLYEQVEVLQALVRLHGLFYNTGWSGSAATVTVENLLDEAYHAAAGGDGQGNPFWAVIRRVAGLLSKVDVGLADAVTDILVRQKQVCVGKSYREDSLIVRPMTAPDILAKIHEFGGEDVRERVLSQEILIYLAMFIKGEPELFKGLLTLRVGYLALLLTSELANDLRLRPEEAYERLMQLSPSAIRERLHRVLVGYGDAQHLVIDQEMLTLQYTEICWLRPPETDDVSTPAGGWRRQRERDGALNRTPNNFCPKVWRLLEHCEGLVIGDKLELRNRLDSQPILAETTAGEKNFALWIDHLLNKIEAPEYRQLNVEALMELAAIAERNPELKIEEPIVLDVIIGHAVRLAWLDQHPDRAGCYKEDTPAAWRLFYETSPGQCAGYVLRALQFLADG